MECELRVDISEEPLFLQMFLAERAQRVKLINELFEMDCCKLYLADPNVMGIYGQGQTTGVVANIGHTLSRIYPIIEGKVKADAIVENRQQTG